VKLVRHHRLPRVKPDGIKIKDVARDSRDTSDCYKRCIRALFYAVFLTFEVVPAEGIEPPTKGL
jgi:hypothetical protein